MREACSAKVFGSGSLILGSGLERGNGPPAPTGSKASLGFSGGGGSCGILPAGTGGGAAEASIFGGSIAGAGTAGTGGPGAGSGAPKRGACGTCAGGPA